MQVALPAAWLLPDFSPGLWGETLLGPGTKKKESGSARAVQPRVLELCSWAGAATGFAASSSPAWRSLCLPMASVRQGPGPCWGPCSATVQGRSSPLQPCRLWGDSTCRGKFPKAVAVSCLSGADSGAEAMQCCMPKAKGTLGTFHLGSTRLPKIQGSCPLWQRVWRELQRSLYLLVSQAHGFFLIGWT